MSAYFDNLAARLEALPVPVALELPGGKKLGAAENAAAVVFRVRERKAALALASGQIGYVGMAIVEGQVAFEGNMRDLMAAAEGLLPASPIQGKPSAWQRLLGWLRSRAAHTLAGDARNIQFHYDVSDDFTRSGSIRGACIRAPITAGRT